MRLTRAGFLSLLATPLVLPAIRAAAQPAWPRRVTDMAGRAVTLKAPPRAILLGESFQLLAMGLLHPDPVSLLAGMGGDLRQADPRSHEAWLRRFPALAAVPEVTGGVGQAFSLERVLSLRPDLVILGAWQRRRDDSAQELALLETAGIPVLFIDVFRRPLENVGPSIRLLGEVLDRREAAAEFVALHEARLTRLRERVAGRPPGPLALLTAFPGRWPCCWVAGASGGGEYLAPAGLRNATEGQAGLADGGLTGLEQVLAMRPDLVIGTGLALSGDGRDGGLALGSGVPAAVARESLARLAREAEWRSLGAVRDGRLHGLWNFFTGSPIGMVAAEAVARWGRPDLFADLDPAATLEEINRRFSAVPFEGTYWVSTDPAQDGPRRG